MSVSLTQCQKRGSYCSRWQVNTETKKKNWLVGREYKLRSTQLLMRHLHHSV